MYEQQQTIKLNINNKQLQNNKIQNQNLHIRDDHIYYNYSLKIRGEPNEAVQLYNINNKKYKYWLIIIPILIILILSKEIIQYYIQYTIYQLFQDYTSELQDLYQYIITNSNPSYNKTLINYKQRLLALRLLLKLNNLKQLNKQSQKLLSLEKIYYQDKYKINQYQELPFCIVIPSYNNNQNQRYLHNIRSIVRQNYQNYHIVFFDDGSTDGTGLMVKEYLEKQNKINADRYRIIINQKNMKAMKNIKRAAQQFCQPNEIFMIVDGDDELIGQQVLKLFNSIFQKEKVWFVYSNFLYSSQYKIGYSHPFPQIIIERNQYRKYPFVTSHLRAFYTKLFLNIKDDDLKDSSGNYFRAANDVAICIPILQQSHNRVFYLSQLTYYYHQDTDSNNHKIRQQQQKSNNDYIKTLKIYKQLKYLNQSAQYL